MGRASEKQTVCVQKTWIRTGLEAATWKQAEINKYESKQLEDSSFYYYGSAPQQFRQGNSTHGNGSLWGHAQQPKQKSFGIYPKSISSQRWSLRPENHQWKGWSWYSQTKNIFRRRDICHVIVRAVLVQSYINLKLLHTSSLSMSTSFERPIQILGGDRLM